MAGRISLKFQGTNCPHLLPGCCALVTAVALLGGVRGFVGARIPGRLPYYAAHAMSFKVNGNALQRVAFRTADELPIYGSSELDRWADNRADAFFRGRPTGFAVFPVGRGGATCFLIAQKLAAVGDAARGKKVVVFLSPTWFLQPGVGEDAVTANLGIPQLSAWVFGGELQPALKTAVARRLRDFPGSLENQPLLAEAVQSLADPTPPHRLGFALLRPLGAAQDALLEWIDYGVIFWEMVFPQQRWSREPDQSAPPMLGGQIDWERLGVGAEGQAGGEVEVKGGGGTGGVVPTSEADRKFVARLQASREFEDLALLVRVLRELRLDALFISQPFNEADGVVGKVSPSGRRIYYERVRTVVEAGGFPLRDFSGHEDDPAFFSDVEHPSGKAWLFYDREINRFRAVRSLN